MSWITASAVVWITWATVGVVWEVLAWRAGDRALTLTELVRDRLMRAWPVRVGVLAFLSWLLMHFAS